MWSYRMYFADGQEHFEYDPWGSQGSAATQKSYPYLESLLSFLELDCAQIEHQLHEILMRWECFFSTGEATCADDAMQKLGELAAQHIYFRLPYLQWFAHKTDGTLAPEMKTELLQLLEQLPMYQRQAQTFLAEVLDIDQTGRETQRSMRSRYLFDGPRDPALFCFQTIPVSFGPLRSDSPAGHNPRPDRFFPAGMCHQRNPSSPVPELRQVFPSDRAGDSGVL